MNEPDDRLGLFLSGFSARDLAEPLISFDRSVAVSAVRDSMDEHSVEIVGIRSSGMVTGWLSRSDLVDDDKGLQFRPIDDASVVTDVASLSDVVQRLKSMSCLFVRTLGQVGGVICRGDLQKPPMRMWLFGLVTITELRTTRLIDQFCPNNTWRRYLSDGRLEKAVALRDERRRRGQRPSLLDCLQFADKGQIVARDEQIRRFSRFTTKRAVEEFVRELQDLRNNLAHSQDILGNWDTIVELATNIHWIVIGPSTSTENSPLVAQTII